MIWSRTIEWERKHVFEGGLMERCLTWQIKVTNIFRIAANCSFMASEVTNCSLDAVGRIPIFVSEAKFAITNNFPSCPRFLSISTEVAYLRFSHYFRPTVILTNSLSQCWRMLNFNTNSPNTDSTFTFPKHTIISIDFLFHK